MTELKQGEFLRHEPCEKCGSSDGKAVYDSDTAFCYVCSSYFDYSNQERSIMSEEVVPKSPTSLVQGEFRPLVKRGISREICQKYGYHIGTVRGETAQIADYYDTTGQRVGQKVRSADKSFSTLGKVGATDLFGRQLWREKGRQVIITEGEIDCLSIAEAFGGKYPVVSLPTGANSATKAIKSNIEWLSGFTTVVLWFDNDEAGRKALDDVAGLFKGGVCKVITTSYKDANELLLAEGKSAVVNATYEAKSYRPDGILAAEDLWEQYKEKPLYETHKILYPAMDDMLKGIRKGEVITFTAGSGIGKSTLVKEIAYDLMINQGCKIGLVALEENWRKSLSSFLALYANTPIFIGDELSPELEQEAWDATMGTGNLFLYDHFGSLDSDNLMAKLRVLVHSCEVDFIVLDHISIVVSGMEGGGDERKAIDKLMTDLRSLAEETRVGILVVSHLRRIGGERGHEDGAQISLGHLRGSGAIAQLSDAVIGLERDAQSETEGDQIKVRVLKNRFAGDLGTADTLAFNKVTGRLLPVLNEFVNEEQDYGF